MLFSYNWLKDYVKNLPEPRKLAELLTLHSFEVREMKRVDSDFVFDIDILPNRAGDCFSHLGVARECSLLTDSEFKMPASKPIEDKKLRARDFVSVAVQSPACLRYTARVVTDLQVGPSPKWLKNRLEVCGLQSINNVVDVANYVMLETGQPLHAFDGGKLDGKKIVVRPARKGEKIVTLDGQKFELNPKILAIADARRPVAIAGVKGGKEPEIDKRTKVVVLESANFDFQAIRRGSRELELKTDASLRFEHGIDPNLTEVAINRAAFLIQEVAAGSVAQGLVDIYPKKIYPKRVGLDLDYLARLLGVKVEKVKVKRILAKLGFKIIKEKFPNLIVEIPTRRLDISVPEDLIEEIGRIYGYEKIIPAFPTAVLVPAKRNDEIFWENMTKDILKEAGFTEVYNYSFVSEKAWGAVELKNPTSAEYKYLRSSLIPNLLKNVEKNLKYTRGIKIFELGRVFSGRKEKRQLTGLMVDQDFYQLKGVVDLLLQGLGISNIWYDDYRATPESSPSAIWHPKKSAEIKVNGLELGFLGEIKEKPGIVIFDIDFEKLQKLASEEHEYLPLSKFPSAVRDLAILVPRGIKVDQVLNQINIVGGKLVRDVDLFDIYEGEEMPQGKKNLAFHIIYQAEDRTLKSKEIDEIHQKIIKALEQNSGWQVRK